MPIRRNGRLWQEGGPAALARNDIERAIQRLGRTVWKRWSGCHVRSRIEARMRNLKSVCERIASREPDRQTAAIHIRVALMNGLNASAPPRSNAWPDLSEQKGHHVLKSTSATMPNLSRSGRDGLADVAAEGLGIPVVQTLRRHMAEKRGAGACQADVSQTLVGSGGRAIRNALSAGRGPGRWREGAARGFLCAARISDIRPAETCNS